jgi:uncharacterized protein YqgC (DUF456 family)
MDLSRLGEYTLLTVTLAVMLVGVVGLIIPILPGLVIIWLAGLVYGILSGFTTAGWILFGLMTLLMAVGSVVDNVIMGASARQKGASWLAIGVSMLLAVVGSILLPPFGGLILALLGLFGLEFWRLRDWRKALESAKSMAFGCGWSAVVRTVMG